MTDINTLRQEINTIDQQLIELLAKRREVCLGVAAFKFDNARPITDKAREEAHLDELMKYADSKEVSLNLVRKVFTDIFTDSVALQTSYTYTRADTTPEQFKGQINIASLGPEGSYSYHATCKYFRALKKQITIQNCSSFDEIIAAVENGSALFGVMHIENTSSGCINEVYDLLQDTKVKIVGELTINIDHCVITNGNKDLSLINTIYSHPQPATQCSNWLKHNLPHATIKTTTASSAAIQKVAALNDPTVAALGCGETGKMFGLTIAAENIANQAHNVTRFIVISLSLVQVPDYIPAKTSLTFTTTNKPGALVKVLEIFSRNNINIAKLQSRPRSPNANSDSIWAETFYADVCINNNTVLMQEILKELKEVTGNVKVLGCYPLETTKQEAK